jgi:hypothetical protein
MANAKDKALITKLGGPRAVCEMLGYELDGGLQRVQNWMTRGIPAAIKLSRPDLFLPALMPWDGKERRTPPPCSGPKPKKAPAKKRATGKKG